MQAIATFNDSRIGSDMVNAVTDLTRTGLSCATAAEIGACHWVPQDKMAWVDPAQPHVNVSANGSSATKHRLALGHVRDKGQLNSVKEMFDWVQAKKFRAEKPPVDIDVYLVGGYAQKEPADSILAIFEGSLFTKAWTGMGEVYAHIRKPNPENRNQNDADGHIPAFVAQVTIGSFAMYPIGTSDIAGCIAVLAVPKGATVAMKKVHIYDRYNTVHQGQPGLSRVQLDRIGFP